jgi:hypothetical protein
VAVLELFAGLARSEALGGTKYLWLGDGRRRARVGVDDIKFGRHRVRWDDVERVDVGIVRPDTDYWLGRVVDVVLGFIGMLPSGPNAQVILGVLVRNQAFVKTHECGRTPKAGNDEDAQALTELLMRLRDRSQRQSYFESPTSA